METIDFTALEKFIYDERLLDERSVHGLSHWHQVEFNGLLIARATLADPVVVRLFALFHDSRRTSDGYDEEHGRFGAKYALELRGKHFELDDARFEKLFHACENHTTEYATGDPTIDTCYDADRLDLGRVGILPDPQKMATAFGKKLARKLHDVPFERHREWIQSFAEKNPGRLD